MGINLHNRLFLVTKSQWAEALTPSGFIGTHGLDGQTISALSHHYGFEAKAGQSLLFSHQDYGLVCLFGVGEGGDSAAPLLRGLGDVLKKGDWHLKNHAEISPSDIQFWSGLGTYRFEAYKKAPASSLSIHDDRLEDDARLNVHAALEAHRLCLDLVNRPPNDLGPKQIEEAAKEVAERFGALVNVIVGDDLITQNYPAIFAVGKGAEDSRGPRFIELSYGPEVGLFHVCIVGKGIVFDTGGLNMKSSAGMALMKKDMGGAAHALSLGQWIMQTGLKVRLTILLAVAENAVSGKAMRPSDVISARNGLKIEIGNTDAEGRLVLADALSRAGELKPDLTLCFATLTGAARTALGPELVPLYSPSQDLKDALLAHSQSAHDPLWPMPLWKPYEAALKSDIADLKNDPSSWAQAGSIMAALFLQRFAPEVGQWAHFDLYAHNPQKRAGHPVGAEVQTMRACYELVRSYVKK